MTKGTKIAIGVVAALVVLCVCLGVASFGGLFYFGQQIAESATEDPAEVAEIASGIADYDLPPGFSEQFGMRFLIFDMVAFGSDDNKQAILLMQFSEMIGMDQAEMEQQMNQSVQEQMGQQDLDLQVVDQTTTTIRDETVTLTIREGTDVDDETVRQITGAFPGKGGSALLMIVGPQQSWDQAAIDDFIASIR